MTFPSNSNRDCAKAWEEMPWVLQESASPEQGKWLMEHIAHCESCHAEFAQQQRLQLALSLPPEIPVDAEAGLERLLQRIDAPESGEPAARGSTSWLTKTLVAAVLLQAVSIGVLGMKLRSQNLPQYHTLSQEAPPAPRGAIRVVPAGNMTLADWDALLRANKLHVVNGPNAAGAYTVVASDTASTPAQEARRLRAVPGIRLAEPVDRTP